jgi:hypothetical protein
MSAASPSMGAIRAQIQAIRGKAPNAKVFGIYTPGRWTGPPVIGAGDDQVAIYQCDSPLQMRLALQASPENISATVIVTPLDQAKISDDILLRMAMRKIHPINSWEIVRTLFKARQLDPRITRHAFLAELLMERAGSQDVPPVAGGLLDAETVWGILLQDQLGLASAHPDVTEILRCGAEADLAERWKSCSAEFRSAAKAWISETAGDLAEAVLGCMESEHGAKALAMGLVMSVVYDDTVGHELDKAAGRLEALAGVVNLPTGVARRWRDAASAAVEPLAREVRRRGLEQAESILQSIGAASHAWRSDQLESGFEQRLSRLGQVLTAHVDSRATAVSGEFQSAYDSVRRHRLGRENGRRMERVAMSIRLTRWLADRRGAVVEESSNLLTHARRYAGDSGFVDWARQVLHGGEPNKDLAAAFVRLVDCVTELREAENLRFGNTVVEQRAMGDADSGLIPVEQIIEQVVVKAAEIAPTLLLLVDGMSWAVFRELVADITKADWIELGFAARQQRLIGLAALPSVTEVCRTSLLCGKLRRGQAADEVQGFSTHPQMLALSQAGLAPKLFHKAALQGDDDSSLAGDIRNALANKKQRLVGIIINAVDDHLDKGEQIDAVWSTEHIRVLEPILAEARAAGRLVILLSDHGHVLDRQTEYHQATDGLRWRSPGSAIIKGELAVSSSRVIMPDGGCVVLPWSERIRYGLKKNGYHGGICPQEMLIPIGILWPQLEAPEGFQELPSELPFWWTEPTASGPMPVLPTTTRRAKRPADSKQLTFSDALAVSRPRPVADETWIKALLQSDVFAEQKQRLTGRTPVADDTVEKFLAALVSRGGSMMTSALAGAVGVPEHRLPGLLAVMQRLLNVEGFAVLDRQDAANTVVLNVQLLKKQFELGE